MAQESKDFIETIKGKDGFQLKGNLSLISFKEDNVFIVYAPTLDLSGYGNTEQEAKESLNIALKEYFQYTLENNTLKEDLLKLGWHTNNELFNIDFTEIVTSNDYFKSVMNEKQFSKYNQLLVLS